MDSLQAAAQEARTETSPDFDAIIIGAGVSGLYQLYKLRELGINTRVFEAGTGVGGTWYWNRYPGARFDSEIWSYDYSFSRVHESKKNRSRWLAMGHSVRIDLSGLA